MTLKTTKHIMATEEFLNIVCKLKGGRNGWIDRVCDLTGIDKSTLSKYASGNRAITNTHALFLRQTYFLQCGFPDLANDLNVMIRSEVSKTKRYPCYEDIQAKASMISEIKELASRMKRIKEIVSEYQ